MSLKSSTLLLHLLTLLHLLYTSSSTPIESRQSSPPLQEFQPLAVLLNNPKIPFIEIIANGGNFWFFKRTTTDPPGHGTGLLATGNNISEISLWSAAPGGQRVYVAPNGALKYNTPNSSTHHSPHPSALFNFNFDTGVDRLAEITYIGRCSRAGGSGFKFCPTAEPPEHVSPTLFVNATPVQVFVDVQSLSDGDVPLGSVAGCDDMPVIGRLGPVGQPSSWVYV